VPEVPTPRPRILGMVISSHIGTTGVTKGDGEGETTRKQHCWLTREWCCWQSQHLIFRVLLRVVFKTHYGGVRINDDVDGGIKF
jgi:hypothetical protein